MSELVSYLVRVGLVAEVRIPEMALIESFSLSHFDSTPRKECVGLVTSHRSCAISLSLSYLDLSHFDSLFSYIKKIY